MCKVKIFDVEGNEITYSYEEYVERFPEATAEYGHRDYFDIWDSKYGDECPEIFDSQIEELISSTFPWDKWEWEEDTECRFSFEWKTEEEREELFNKIMSLR